MGVGCALTGADGLSVFTLDECLGRGADGMCSCVFWFVPQMLS